MESALERLKLGNMVIDTDLRFLRPLEDSHHKTGWSDEVLEELASLVKFPKQSFEEQHIKLIIEQFFYFYFTGNIENLDNLQCIIYSAVALLNVPDKKGYKRVFSDQCKKKGDKHGKCFYTWQKVVCDSLDSVDASNNDFLKKIKTSLRLWDDPQNSIEEQGKLMRLTGFLAMTLFRVIDQNKKLTTTLGSKEYREILAESVGWKMNEPFSPPSQSSLNQSLKCINNSTNLHVNKFFAIIVRQWVISEKLHPDPETKNLLYLSLLESTEYHGMGIFKMFFAISKYTGKSCEEILVTTFEVSPGTEIFCDWRALLSFCKDYILKNNLPLSLPWTRLIDTDYFRYASPRKSGYVVATFSKILENIEGPGVWQAPWNKKMKRPEFIIMGKELGPKIYERLMNKDSVEAQASSVVQEGSSLENPENSPS